MTVLEKDKTGRTQTAFDESKVLHAFTVVLIFLVLLLSFVLVLTLGEPQQPNQTGNVSANFPLPVSPWH